MLCATLNDNLLIALAKKYDVFTSEDEENRIEEIDTNIAPEIVLSETFIRLIMGKIKTNKEFEQVAILIEEARNRAFSKVNEELVLLYFKVGEIVSAKVAAGAWGDNTVVELAKYIALKLPELSGFNRRVVTE